MKANERSERRRKRKRESREKRRKIVNEVEWPTFCEIYFFYSDPDAINQPQIQTYFINVTVTV